jgi:uncharacterized protein YceK
MLSYPITEFSNQPAIINSTLVLVPGKDNEPLLNVILMKRILFVISMGLLLLSSTGCGTIRCLSSDGTHIPGKDIKPPAPNAVYGGVRWDMIGSTTADTTGLIILNAIPRYVDLPFSFVLDTIVLPYTLFSEEKTVRNVFEPMKQEPE